MKNFLVLGVLLVVITSALANTGVVGPPMGGVAANLAAPTILAHGNEAQIQRFVPTAIGC